MNVIPHVSDISEAGFRTDYLRKNRPVVVKDGLRNSPATKKWGLDYFEKRFGSLDVAVSGEFFYPESLMTLSSFIETAKQLEQDKNKANYEPQAAPYMRLSHPEFGGADFTSIFFDELSSEWERPYFLPKGFYFSPFALKDRLPNRRRFPEWGLFISPRGAFTSIHIDRTNDNAILASTCGRKVGFLFEPTPVLLSFLAKEHRDREAGERRASLNRLLAVLAGVTPDYPGLTAHYFELEPGEVLFIPKRWAHEIFTLSACVSLTYNFVHFSDLDHLYLIHRALGIGFH